MFFLNMWNDKLQAVAHSSKDADEPGDSVKLLQYTLTETDVMADRAVISCTVMVSFHSNKYDRREENNQ